MKTDNAEALFGGDKMGLIILRYAVPTILSLLIQTLYNIADQIFIGWDMGFRGNAAVNVVYPVMTVFGCSFFLLAIPIYGFSIVSTGLFQAIGKPVQAGFMALSRQIIYFIPLAMYLAPRYGVVGMLWASPIGDIFAFITCLTLFLREWKQLGEKEGRIGGSSYVEQRTGDPCD